MSNESQIDKAAALVEAAQKAGADGADAVVIKARSVSVSVRFRVTSICWQKSCKYLCKSVI